MINKFSPQILKILEEKAPSIAKIFTIGDGEEKKINFYGILAEGALMHGNAIYNIGAECLIKYFRKEKHQLKEQVFAEKLSDAFIDHNKGKQL